MNGVTFYTEHEIKQKLLRKKYSFNGTLTEDNKQLNLDKTQLLSGYFCNAECDVIAKLENGEWTNPSLKELK